LAKGPGFGPLPAPGRRGKTLNQNLTIVKIGGSTLDDMGTLAPLWRALASLSERMGVVIVHGGGKAVDALLARLGLPVERREGLRVTPDDQIDLIAGVLAGTVNKRLVGAFNAAGGRAVGLCMGDSGVAECRRLTRTVTGTPVDVGCVGEMTGGDGALPATLLRAGFVPVISSIGIDASGRLLNINADDGAAGLAGAMGASALVLMTDVPGIKDGSGAVCPRLTPGRITGMIASGEVSGGMIPKSRAAAHVVAHHGVRVVILGADPSHLMAWIGGGSVGTEIVPDPPSPADHGASPGAPHRPHAPAR